MMMKCAQLDRNMNITNIWNFQQGSNAIPSRNIEIVIGHATPDQEKDIQEKDRDRGQEEGDRQDINSKKGSVDQYWNVFIHQSEGEEVVQVDQARRRDRDPVLDHLKPGFHQNVKRKRQRKEENLQNIMMMVMMNILDSKDRELHREDRHIGKESDDRDRQYHLHRDPHHNRDRQVQIFLIMVQEFD